VDSKGYVTTVGEALDYFAEEERRLIESAPKILRRPPILHTGRRVGRTAALKRQADADTRIVGPS
jgi:hypothetical protein